MIEYIDTGILVLLVLLTIKGIWRGFIKESVSLITYGIAFLAATSQLDKGTKLVENSFNFHPMLAYMVSYIGIFVVTMFVVKFFVKNVRKMIKKDIESGFVDSLAGAILGFALGATIVSMMIYMVKPIPMANKIFSEKHKSLFIPRVEKYAEPVLTKVVGDPMDKLPVGDLLSSANGDKILPDMMKGLLGDGLADKVGDIANLKENVSQVLGGGASVNTINNLADIINQAGVGDGTSMLDGESMQDNAIKLLNIDTTKVKGLSPDDLSKILKTKKNQ